MQFQNEKEKVLIVDFGSQVTKLIARRIREYKVLSQIVTFRPQQIPSFDLCFSNLPDPLDFYHVKITRKTLQFENVYLQVLCNQNDCLFFCYSGVFPKFLETLERVILDNHEIVKR